MATRTKLLIRPFALVAAGALLVACGNGSTDHAGDAPSAPESGTPTGTQEPATPIPATPTRLPSDVPAEQRLLDAAQFPGFNDGWRWAVRATTPVGPRQFGRCAKFDMLSIGAVDGVERTYADNADPKSGSVAAMQVIEFPDPRTAQRATAVLKSWHADCQKRISASMRPSRGAEVGELQDVPVTVGTGSWYLTHWSIPGEPEDHHFQAFGMATEGQRMALLRMDNIGQDRNYDEGQDPMQLAVAAAAARL